MADLSLALRVFVASSAEVQPEREAAEAEVRALARDAAHQRLLLESFLWEEDSYPFCGRPQATLNEDLRQSEHVVVILWSRVGEGTREELKRALEQGYRGQTDNVSIYFKTAPPPTPILPELSELRGHISEHHLALSWNFESTDDFRRLFAQHLRKWLHRWDGVVPCCRYALENSPPTGRAAGGSDPLVALGRNPVLAALPAVVRGALGREAVGLYQRFGPEEATRRPIARAALNGVQPDWVADGGPVPASSLALWRIQQQQAGPNPLRPGPGGAVHFADYEWFWYFAAVGLADAVRAGRTDAVARWPYLNEVHQYLAGYVRQEQIDLLPTLRRWLRNEGGVTTGTPVVRDFAAYVLGMLGDIESQDWLAEALDRDESEDVRTYCITSLGKLRSRRYLPRLVERYNTTSDPRRRLLLAQAVSNIAGIARFPL
jgi:hypothetical protein